MVKIAIMLFQVISFVVLQIPKPVTEALAASSSSRRPICQSPSKPVQESISQSDLLTQLQSCGTPHDILHRVGRYVSPQTDPDGSLASLVLIRLQKQLIALDNQRRHLGGETPILILSDSPDTEDNAEIHAKLLIQVVTSMIRQESIFDNDKRNSTTEISSTQQSVSRLDAVVEATKACAVILRLLNGELSDTVAATLRTTLREFWHTQASLWVSHLQPCHVTGLKWAFDTLQQDSPHGSFPYQHQRSQEHQRSLSEPSRIAFLPPSLEAAYQSLKIPFRVLPGFLSTEADLSVNELQLQVPFRVDTIRTSSNQIVTERRLTAWQGDETVGPFLYAGKSMPRESWSPLVERIRTQLREELHCFYDCCLLNLYPDGQSAMRYHIDPDQGTLWDYDTAVVSVGATRRFSFRSVPGIKTVSNNHPPHSFYVFHGDVVRMFDDCQVRFQHSVKKADNTRELCARSSLVFKQTWHHR